MKAEESYCQAVCRPDNRTATVELAPGTSLRLPLRHHSASTRRQSSATSPSMPSFTASPVRFPYEILGEIFSHCDQPTLGAVSRVSFACLELSSAFLYTDVVLKDLVSIRSLFRLWVSTATGLLPKGGTTGCRLFRALGDEPLTACGRSSTNLLRNQFPLWVVPQSDRVSAHTSLLRIHSITLEVPDTKSDSRDLLDDVDWCAIPDDGSYLGIYDAWFARYQPGLRISVLVISVPASNTPCSYNLGHFNDRIDPSIVILRARPADGASSVTVPPIVDLDPSSGNSGPEWPHLKTFIFDSVSLDPAEWQLWRGYSPVADRSVIHDLTSFSAAQFASEDPKKAVVASDFVEHQERIQSEQFHDHGRLRDVKIRAWVSSQEAKESLLKRHYPPGFMQGQGGQWSVDVVDKKIRHLREEVIKGVWKGMDWAVLER